MNEFIKSGKYKILSGSALKMIALVCMIIDHIAYFFSYGSDITIISVGTYTLSLYRLMRSIGRLSFPIYCFLIVEGFLHTRDRKKYLIRLFVFAVISEIPWDLAHALKFPNSGLNVFFTLFLGCFALMVIEQFKENRTYQIIGLVALLIVSSLLKADYGLRGFCLIVMIYALREQKLLQAVVACGLLSSTFRGALAFIPINMYNGKRGFINNKPTQIAFYAFYPLHLLVIYLIKLQLT